jgi:carbohydrate diacid regulator
MNENGLILACSDEKKIGTDHNIPADFLDSRDLSMVVEGITYKKIFIRNKLDYIAFVKSNSQDHLNYLSLLVINIINLKIYHEEKFDKRSFIKNILLDNILPADISIKAKELRVSGNVCRAVFLIKTKKYRSICKYNLPKKRDKIPHIIVTILVARFCAMLLSQSDSGHFHQTAFVTSTK